MSFVIIISGVILVFIGIFLVIKIIDLYFLSVFVNEREKFVKIVGISSGKIIFLNVCIWLVFKLVDVFLIFVLKFCNIGCIIWIINGRLINVRVIIILIGVNVILNVNNWLIYFFGM